MRNLVLLGLFVFVASCKNCTRYARGYIVDAETSKPVYHARIISYAALDDRKRDERLTFSDSSGFFETSYTLERVAKCGILKLIVSDSNYHTAYEAELPVDDTIFLRKIVK